MHALSLQLPFTIGSHLRDIMNQADVLGLAKFVSACLKCCECAPLCFCPGVILVSPIESVPIGRTNFRYPLNNRGGRTRRGSREHSAPATATPPASK
eukprot:188927-Pelagomonas_calceolata.AAC.1